MRTRQTWLILAAIVALAGLVGCSGRDDPQQTADVRRDVAPLTTRFPAIGDPVSVEWMSGVVGSEDAGRTDAPGPSSYWIEAVVELEPDVAQGLLTTYGPTDSGQAPPELHDPLAEDLPDGPFLTSDALDTALSEGDWDTRAYLSPEAEMLLLVSFDWA